MKNSIFTSTRIWENGIAIIRIITGIMMAYHGYELFDSVKMADYGKWMNELHFPMPLLMAFLGKGTEFFGGILLALGLFTRIALIPLSITMLIIPFFMGKGKVFMEDQHPFLFVLLFLIFLFEGAGKWSLDYLFFDKNKRF
jgi:putative oxidoreductase